jgi:hypothetical protein
MQKKTKDNHITHDEGERKEAGIGKEEKINDNNFNMSTKLFHH